MVSRELAAFIVTRHAPVILNNPSDAVPFQHVASSAPLCTGESRRKEIVWPRVSGTCDTSFLPEWLEKPGAQALWGSKQ